MPNSLSSINLAKNTQIPVFDKLLDWVLTIGRLIVIITEVVAVTAFIYRFSLDERLVELHSAIKQKQSVISVLKSDESKYRNLQDRIAIASTFSAKTINSNQTIADIVSLIPDQVKIGNLLLNKDQVNLSINVVSVSSLENFINSLKNYRNIKSISIDNIENKPSIGLSVNLTAMLK